LLTSVGKIVSLNNIRLTVMGLAPADAARQSLSAANADPPLPDGNDLSRSILNIHELACSAAQKDFRFAQTTSHVAQGHGSASSRRLSLL
jgi:hypothetical protein